MKRKKILSFLAMGAMMIASLVSCSDSNIESTTPGSNPLAASLTGSWYGEYSADGETTAGANSIAGTYIKAVQGLEFKEDGTGTYAKFLCNAANEPLSIFGGAMDQANGRFHYTSSTDGTVTITLDGDGNSDNPKKWTMKFADGSLSGTNGGATYQLTTADDDRKAMLANWEESLRSGGNSEEKSFLKDWANCDKVYVNGLKNPVYTPWKGIANSDIPEDIRKDYLKNDGWEMAFCCLNDPAAPYTRYFGLYNRYRGILRVFMYIPDAKAYGKEMGFTISRGDNIRNGYPFYNAMMYGIPSNKPYTSWNMSKDLATGTSKYKPLSWRLTPYTKEGEAKGVSVYWHCFDLDMSGYVPKDETTPWKSHIDSDDILLSIAPISQDESTIKLSGQLLGKLEGTYSEPVIKTSPANPDLHSARLGMNGIGAIFSGVTSLLGTAASISNVFGPERDEAGKAVGAAAWWGIGLGITGMLFNTVGTILAGSDNTVSSTKEKGTIDLNLDANIDMNGIMRSWKSLSDGGMLLTPKLLKATNPNCHIGEGCFGLEESPVVCIAKEDLLSETDNVNITMVNGKYMAGSKEENERYALRFITFLDPNSIKINLNTDLYHDIENLTVTAFCAVNTSLGVGNTDSYRDLINLNKRPTLSFPKAQNGLIELNDQTSMKLHNISCDDVLKGCPISFPENKKSQFVKLEEQKGDEVYRYYGLGSDLLGSNIMVEPQAYLPFSGFDFKEPVAPDIVVPVIVTFDCKEHKNVLLIKQFIPDFKLVSRSELSTYYTKLQDFKKKSEDHEEVGKVNNAQSIGYKSKSHIYMTRALNTLKKVTTDK